MSVLALLPQLFLKPSEAKRRILERMGSAVAFSAPGQPNGGELSKRTNLNAKSCTHTLLGNICMHT